MIEEILKQAVILGTSDIFMIPGMPIAFKINGIITTQNDNRIFPEEMNQLIQEIYEIADHRNLSRVLENGDDDFSFALKGISRFRASIMKQRGSLAAIIRIVRFDLPSYQELQIPSSVMALSKLTKGLVLVTGPAGSGKSTTLSCIINEINENRNAHIITLEDPIEFLHHHKKSVVTQREIGLDTNSYVDGLRASLRQAPDVILLGEMRDYETIRTAMTAAETGHFVISTLHTIGAANTIDRIIDVFPADAQQQIRIQLSMVLQAVVSQQLVPKLSGGLCPAFEIMTVTDAIRNMIRESKIHQIDNVINTNMTGGMISMDTSLMNLYRSGTISKDSVINYSSDPKQMEAKLSLY